MGQIDFGDILISLVVLLFSLSIHESAHAWTADYLGDFTGRYLGRVSLNPLVHIDPIGTVLFPLIAALTHIPLIGWAKPVPVNAHNLKDPKRDQIFIAAAGPIVNLIAAAIFFIIVRAVLALYGGQPRYADAIITPLFQFCLVGMFVNVFLAVFNLIPIPPLDGSWILYGLLPADLSAVYDRFRPYGFLVLLALLYTGVLGFIWSPLISFLNTLLES